MAMPQVRILERSRRFEWPQVARRYLANRWVVPGLAGAVLVVGAALNWGWLVAAGIVPILISLAPCAIMCGLGLCGMKMMGGSCEKQSAPAGDVKRAVGPSDILGAQTAAAPVSALACCQGQAEAQPQIGQQQANNERSESHA